MSLRLVIADAAQQDLLELWVGIAEHNTRAADETVGRMQQVAKLLCTQPEMGVLRPDLLPNIRCFPVGNHLIVYHLAGDVLAIDRILDGRRDPSSPL